MGHVYKVHLFKRTTSQRQPPFALRLPHTSKTYNQTVTPQQIYLPAPRKNLLLLHINFYEIRISLQYL